MKGSGGLFLIGSGVLGVLGYGIRFHFICKRYRFTFELYAKE